MKGALNVVQFRITRLKCSLLKNCPSFRVRVGLEDSRLEVDSESSRIVGAGEVVKRPNLAPSCLVLRLGGEDARVFLDRQHLALVADCVHRVLVSVRRLEQPALKFFDEVVS